MNWSVPGPDKVRDEKGLCRECRQTPGQFHLDECSIQQVRMQSFRIMVDVKDEVDRQLRKWGVQNHPMGVHPDSNVLEDDGKGKYVPLIQALNNAEFEKHARDRTDTSAAAGTLTYEKILTEEYGELLGAEDPQKAYDEAIQVAAVAVSMAASIRRNEMKSALVKT